MRQILRHFQGAKIFSLSIANRKVTNVHEFAAEVDPKFSPVALAAAEVAKDFLYNVHAPRRVAMLDLPAPDSLTAHENPIRTFREKSYGLEDLKKFHIHMQDL